MKVSGSLKAYSQSTLKHECFAKTNGRLFIVRLLRKKIIIVD